MTTASLSSAPGEPRGSHLLSVRTVEKPWGRDHLPPPFVAPEGQRIGEIWFEPPTVVDDLLVKYIFTSENLSIQVHPSDAQTQAMGLGRQGKEECWLVIDADPGATLAIGFGEHCDSQTMRQAAVDGSIVDKLESFPVRAGDFFYIPANTVHAIGGGVSLIEVQQNSDITYRLYDYGRPRPLHLDTGMEVASGGVYEDRHRTKLPDHGNVTLVEGPHFRLDRIDARPDEGMARRYADKPLLVIPTVGRVRIDGEAVAAGQCAVAEGLDRVVLGQGAQALLAQSCSGC